MKNIIEAGELPCDEKVYLKKDWLGWRTVEPYSIDGKTNYFNLLLGGRRGLFTLVITLAVLALLYMGVNELIGFYKIIAENPCDFCKDCFVNPLH